MLTRHLALLACAVLLAGCAGYKPVGTRSPAMLTPPTKIARDLVSLPPPKGRIPVAVYGFRDQTGQYKPAPDSSFSTSVTQGAAAMLIKALRDSRWFIPLERENLQDLLTERKIIRALEGPQDKGAPMVQLPPLMPATLLIEGAIIAYENNVKSGGAGVRYLGVGPSDTYREDQVTLNLRAVDIRSGQVLQSVTTTKTIYSIQVNFGVFRFVSLKSLLEAEIGFAQNEPAQQCVREALETALVHLILQGVRDRTWNLNRDEDIKLPLVQRYLRAYEEQQQLSPLPPLEAAPIQAVPSQPAALQPQAAPLAPESSQAPAQVTPQAPRQPQSLARTWLEWGARHGGEN